MKKKGCIRYMQDADKNLNAASSIEQRTRLAGDPHRPHYHFLPPAHWMNDPNGLIQWKGKYHLFYQYNPYAPLHARIHWGHTVSADLVHWRDLPIALTPTLGQADADGCWSGCTIDNNGIPTLVYTGIHPQTVCLASSNDDLLNWQYHPANPVIQNPPNALQAGTGGHFRDPFVWKENDCWYMLIGSKQEHTGGMILLYRSSDLLHWEYLHPFLLGNASSQEPLWTGAMWECPNLLTFGDQRFLIFSIQDAQGNLLYPLYASGTFHDEQFTPNANAYERLAYGNCFYAPQIMRDAQGRSIMWGWLMEKRSQARVEQAGWSGVMSLPIIVEPLSQDYLSLKPAPELTSLRAQHWHIGTMDIESTKQLLHENNLPNRLEIIAEYSLEQPIAFALTLSPDTQEHLSIVYQSTPQRITVEYQQADIRAEVNQQYDTITLKDFADRVLRLHLFLDHSVLELFVNERYYLASRIYLQSTVSMSIDIFARQGTIHVNSLDIWSLASIWDNLA